MNTESMFVTFSNKFDSNIATYMKTESFEQLDLSGKSEDLDEDEMIILKDFLGSGPDMFFHCQSANLAQGEKGCKFELESIQVTNSQVYA